MVPTIRLASLAELSDAELLAQVARLATQERDATVALVAHLAELDARRLYLAEGYPSLFAYCTQRLHLAEHAAYGRIEAARVVRRYPVVLERLADGSVTLTTVVAPLAPERYRVQFTASAETYAKLRLAQDLLRHQIPAGDVGQVLDRALTVLVDALLKQKIAATDRPRVGKPPRPRSRHVPAAVRRAVWTRDGGRCAFVSRTGRRCAERGFLEFHHVRPYAAGGAATAENIELRCRAHNGYEAEQVFGPWGESQVREPGSVYVTRRQGVGPMGTRSGPSWTSAGCPP